MGLFENFDINAEPVQEEQVGEIERGAWENLFVSMERSFYNIVDLSATSVRKLSTFSLDKDDPRKEQGIGWIGRNAGKVAADFRERAESQDVAPETDPEMMDKFAELLGATVPYTLFALAGGAVGGAVAGGGAIATGLGAAVVSFASMREDAYRGAIGSGATEKEANTEANIIGGINALIEMAQMGAILRQSKTGGALLKAITLSARNKAWTGVLKSGKDLSMGMVRNALEEAFEEALQGTTSELVPKLLRGKEIEGGAKGFLARRAREAGAGALIGGVFSGLGQLGTTAFEQGKSYIPARPEIEAMTESGTQTEQPEDGQAGITPPDAETDADLEVLEKTADVPDDFSEDRKGQAKSDAEIAAMLGEGADTEGTRKELEPETRTPLQEAVGKISNAIKGRAKGIGKARAVTAEETREELGRRTQAAEETRVAAEKTGSTLDEAIAEGAADLAGTMPEAVFDPIKQDEVTQEDVEAIQREIWDGDKLQLFEKYHADTALKQLMTGIVPTPSDMKILGKIIGREVALGMQQDLRTTSQKRWDMLKDILNIPSTLLTTFDTSLMGRQGLILLAQDPKAWGQSWVASTKAFMDFWGGEKGYTAMGMKDLETRDGAQLAEESGLASTSLAGGTGELDERFMSNIVKKIPIFGVLVRASERAAVLGMNSLRAKTFDNTVREWSGTGKTTQDYKQLAKIINISSGISSSDSKKVKAILPYLTAAFFAPKYVMSRFQILGELGIAGKELLTTGKSISPARLVLVKSMSKFLAAGMMAMFLASLIPGVEVEKDPRSSDFGKIQFGRTRVDVWAGFQQIARTMAQLSMGQGKSINSDEIYTKNRLEIVGKFIQSKLSPALGLGIDVLSGEDFLGRPLPAFNQQGEMASYIMSKLAPLVIQDTIEGIRTEGWIGGLAGGAAAFQGIGVQTFERTVQDNLSDLRDRHSMGTYNTSWDNLGPNAQKMLRAENPDIIEQEKIAKFERRNATFDASRQREAGVAVEKQLPDGVMDELDRKFTSIGGLSRTITRNWRLNAKLYQRYQDDLANMLNKTLPRLINGDSYKAWRPAIQQQMLDFYIRQAKASVRRRIVMDANMKSFEDIRKGVEND